MLIFLYILIGTIASYALYKWYIIDMEEEIKTSNKTEFDYFMDSEAPIFCFMIFLLWPAVIGMLILFGLFKGTKRLLDKTVGKPIERIIRKYNK